VNFDEIDDDLGRFQQDEIVKEALEKVRGLPMHQLWHQAPRNQRGRLCQACRLPFNVFDPGC
jgi:hypothetical protein